MSLFNSKHTKKKMNIMNKTIPSKIPEILSMMEPMNMFEFIDSIILDKEDVKGDMDKDSVVDDVISIFKKNLINIPLNHRPFHNFNEDGNNSVIHYYTNEGWKNNTMSYMMTTTNPRYVTPLKYNSFMYFIQLFYDYRTDVCLDNFGMTKNCFILNTDKAYLLEELMKIVEYDNVNLL